MGSAFQGMQEIFTVEKWVAYPPPLLNRSLIVSLFSPTSKKTENEPLPACRIVPLWVIGSVQPRVRPRRLILLLVCLLSTEIEISLLPPTLQTDHLQIQETSH